MMELTIFSSPELKASIAANARARKIAAGDELMRPGNDILFIPIVLSGCIRILRQDEEGHEVFLYHLFPGQTCAMSLTCCQAGRKSMVRAVAEEDSEILQIPVELTEDWYRFPEWKAYVSSNYNQRFAELINVIDLIAFSHMDQQVLHYLRERAKAQNTEVLHITHQQIAEELNTHREAITRLLKALEKKKIVSLGRNSIHILQA